MQEELLLKNQGWGTELEEGISAFMTRRGDFIDQVHVNPDFQRFSIRQALLAHAPRFSPACSRFERIRMAGWFRKERVAGGEVRHLACSGE